MVRPPAPYPVATKNSEWLGTAPTTDTESSDSGRRPTRVSITAASASPGAIESASRKACPGG